MSLIGKTLASGGDRGGIAVADQQPLAALGQPPGQLTGGAARLVAVAVTTVRQHGQGQIALARFVPAMAVVPGIVAAGVQRIEIAHGDGHVR